MSSKFLVYLLFGFVTIYAAGDQEVTTKTTESEKGRQKRLLFYDEEGNLVKTFSTSQPHRAAPAFASFYSPLFGYIKPTLYTSIPHYIIPVSNEVIERVYNEQEYKKLFILPTKDGKVERNPLCNANRNQIPSPIACNSFLNCWDGWAFEQECPDGLLFSDQGYCDYADNVNCYERRMKEKPKPKCNKDFEAFRSEKCNEFFICVAKEPVRFSCPAGLLYSLERGICDFPQNVKCEESDAATTTSAPPAPSTESSLVFPATSQASVKTVLKNSVLNIEGWSAKVAVSRQDAMRQLEPRRLAKVSPQEK